MLRQEYTKRFEGNNNVTLVIGARCSDGVVIISDRKSVEGTEVATEDKIHILEPSPIVVSGAGIGEIIDKFNERIPAVLIKRQKENYENAKKAGKKVKLEDVRVYDYNFQFLDDCEGLLLKLHNKYKKPIELLVGVGNDFKSELSYINTIDFTSSKRRTFVTIGSGGPYAKVLLKQMYNKDFTMVKMAKIGKYIVNYIAASKLDAYVGEGVQVVLLPDIPKDFEKLSDDEADKYFPHELNMSQFDDRFFIKDMKDFLKDLRRKIIDSS